jgi:hypothetical protein
MKKLRGESKRKKHDKKIIHAPNKNLILQAPNFPLNNTLYLKHI